MDIQKEREAFGAWLKSLNENGRRTYFLGQEPTVAWEAWQAAKSQEREKLKLLLCCEHLGKCESKNGVFNTKHQGEEPCLICLLNEKKAQAKSQAVPECVWVESYDGSVFESSCGHTFELSNDRTLDDNNMKHCCFCGGKIEAQEKSHESN